MRTKQYLPTLIFTLSLLGSFLAWSPALAHFGMVIPSSNIVSQEQPKITAQLSFSHPFAGQGMDLGLPAAFFVSSDGKKESLLDRLQPATIMGHHGFTMDYTARRPGVYWLVMEPQPYWEPSEDIFIIHYTKTAISAFGDDEGWDQPLGLKTEIVPLLRPFANYAGNSLVGQALVNGKPVAGALVEVEYYNQNQPKITGKGAAPRLQAPSGSHETQVVKADGNGIFSFSCPVAGWWGFAALTEGDFTLKDPAGKEKGVELGAVLWLYFDAVHEANQEKR